MVDYLTRSRNPDNSDFEERPEYRTVLANARRRFVLADLLRRVHPVPVYDLADRLSSWAADSPADDEPTRFEAVRRALVDDHLPALVAADLVEPVGDGERYRLTDRGLAVEANARGVDDRAFPDTSTDR